MISFTTSALTPAEDLELRAWLGKSGAHIMTRLIDSKLNFHVCEAIRPALESDDYPAKIEAANDSLTKAKRYLIFLAVWKELTTQPGDAPFEINKLIQ